MFDRAHPAVVSLPADLSGGLHAAYLPGRWRPSCRFPVRRSSCLRTRLSCRVYLSGGRRASGGHRAIYLSGGRRASGGYLADCRLPVRRSSCLRRLSCRLPLTCPEAVGPLEAIVPLTCLEAIGPFCYLSGGRRASGGHRAVYLSGGRRATYVSGGCRASRASSFVSGGRRVSFVEAGRFNSLLNSFEVVRFVSEVPGTCDPRGDSFTNWIGELLMALLQLCERRANANLTSCEAFRVSAASGGTETIVGAPR